MLKLIATSSNSKKINDTQSSEVTKKKNVTVLTSIILLKINPIELYVYKIQIENITFKFSM